jgi:hypothetical protein
MKSGDKIKQLVENYATRNAGLVPGETYTVTEVTGEHPYGTVRLEGRKGAYPMEYFAPLTVEQEIAAVVTKEVVPNALPPVDFNTTSVLLPANTTGLSATVSAVEAPATVSVAKPYSVEDEFEDPKDIEIKSPQHYARWSMQPIEFIAVNDLPWWLANVVKYTMRYDAKDGIADMYKARSYLDMKIRQLEGHKRFWEAPVSVERGLNATEL